MAAVALGIFAFGVALIAFGAALVLGGGYGDAVFYGGVGLVVGETIALGVLSSRR